MGNLRGSVQVRPLSPCTQGERGERVRVRGASMADGKWPMVNGQLDCPLTNNHFPLTIEVSGAKRNRRLGEPAAILKGTRELGSGRRPSGEDGLRGQCWDGIFGPATPGRISLHFLPASFSVPRGTF